MYGAARVDVRRPTSGRAAHDDTRSTSAIDTRRLHSQFATGRDRIGLTGRYHGEMSSIASLLLAYAVGCVSFALVAGRLNGVDLRTVGSGNPGATNVGRALGKGWGRAVLLADMAKGAVPVLLLSAWPGWVDETGQAPVLAAAVLGHIYPVTLGLRGGKGVATLIGGLLALDVVIALFAVLLHVVFKKTVGFVSVASVVLAWAFPLGQGLFWLAGEYGGLDVSARYLGGAPVLMGLALVITVRHRDNFARIRLGAEDRYDDPPEDDPTLAGTPANPTSNSPTRETR